MFHITKKGEQRQPKIDQKLPKIELCNPKMIMSCLATLEMSSFRHAKMPFFRGGHDGRRGHYHDTSGRTKAVTRHPEGVGEGHQAGRGSRDPFAEREANSKDRQANQV